MKGIILLFLFFGCSKSPVFNHKDEGEGLSQRVVNGKQSAELNSILYKYHWITGPSVYDESKILLTIQDKSGKLFDPPEINFQIWMPTMGHGSSPVKVEHLSQGIYSISDIYFIMEGYWELQVEDNNTFKSIGDITL